MSRRVTFADLANLTEAKPPARANISTPLAAPAQPTPPIEELPAVAQTPPVEQTPPFEETPPSQETAPLKNTGQPVQKTPAGSRTGGVQGKGATVIPMESPHLRTPHEITDQILPTLEPASQVILMRLYRLSAGFNSATCQVSIPKLVNTCHVSESKVRNCLRELESKGLIRRLSVDLSNKSQLDRGLTFEVLLPRLATSRGTGGVPPTGGFSQTAPVGGTPNKEKDLKEKNLKEMASCLDCKGTGFWYPGGFDAGVAKCTHEGSSTRKK